MREFDIGRLVLGVLLFCLAAGAAHAADPADRPWARLGRVATPDEVRAWDIDVRSDFKGLPAGSGTVEQGMAIWESRCASCHGVFGESNEVFTPIVGGTTADDIRTGHVKSLIDGSSPQRTTLMKVSQISTLWDYINRAMPWNAPKSLKTDEVYAVLAYILNLGGIVGDDFVLSDKTMAQAQARLPNRNGKARYEGMWNVASKPDVQGDACMANCATTMNVRSMLPNFARDAHGNLAEQNRLVGPVRGADTTIPEPKTLDEARHIAQADAIKAGEGPVPAAAARKRSPLELAQSSNCLSCHAPDKALVGPAFRDVAKRYAGQDGALEMLSARVHKGTQGAWGAVPMPANAGVDEGDVRTLVRWILDGAP